MQLTDACYTIVIMMLYDYTPHNDVLGILGKQYQWCILINEAAIVSNLIAIASRVSEIEPTADRQTDRQAGR